MTEEPSGSFRVGVYLDFRRVLPGLEWGWENWSSMARQDGYQPQRGSELEGMKWGGTGPINKLLGPSNKQLKSGQKSELIPSSKHRLSLSLPSPLHPQEILHFLQRQFLFLLLGPKGLPVKWRISTGFLKMRE